ncbi:ovochymase-1 [Scleropages formosus]|uniref:ovochymase-1 n=1 Tax=Scleropages formosus TaxID=113540 RepID=UPI0010FA79A7|nr:ovochymase-1-like [Scleropages formosus]
MGKRTAEGQRKDKGLTTLEKSLIFLFVLLTVVCVGLVVLYVLEKDGGSSVDSTCSGTQQLAGLSGEFASGNYPSSYDNGQSCSWDITVNPDKVIHLWFEDFSLEESLSCSADFVSVKDSLGIFGKFCGYSNPKPLVTLGNHLVVYFDSNDRGTDKGFKARYKAVTPDSTAEIVGAGGFLEGDHGELQTPGFPGKNYENGAVYQWRVTVPAGEKVRLSFSTFDLVPDACGDFVDVFDGYGDGSARLGRFCGGKVPGPVVSSGNTMTVRFTTDGTHTAQGFHGIYTVASAPPPTTATPTSTARPTSAVATSTPNMSTTPQPSDSGCASDSEQSGRKGVISSKGFPEPYPANLECAWTIRVSQGLLVKLEVTDMAVVGEAGQCGADYLLVSDSLQSLGSHCGFILPPVLISSSNELSLSFQSDARLADRGFSAKWEAVYPEDIGEIQGCGGASRETTGVIKSQNWPANYPGNSQCLWRIEVPPGEKITLNFTYFDVEEASILIGRCYDEVVVYDGATPGAKKYGPYCGSKLPPSIHTTGNTLLVRFHADFFTEAKGFRAYWTTDALRPEPTEPPPLPNPWDNIPIDWPSTCGKPTIAPVVGTRIVNGEPAKPHSWPWQVSMQVWPASQQTPKFSHTCGGTLIHRNWVLTAAHCFIRYADELQRWRMCLGKHNLTFEEPGEKCLGVRGIYRHEGFRYPQVPTVEFDIALVRLDGEVVPSDHIGYACLPPLEEMLPKDKKCYATGWGDETGNSMAPKAAETLNQVALPVISCETCKRMDYWWFQVKPSMICCGYTKPDELKSVCQGDSGGPLVCQDTPGGPWEVHGITSFGPIGCIMDKKPSVFTRSSAYISWMENVIRKDIYDLHTSGCGGPMDLVGSGGSLSSMNHPGFYSNGAQCRWSIQGPAGKLVHLRFETFSLEDSQLCISDKVNISDQIGSLGTHCASGVPADLVSTGETLTLQFSSNGRVVDIGFLVTWRAVDPVDIPGVAQCGGHFTGEHGEIVSPGWPTANYPPRQVCTWRIAVPSAKSIYISFTDFQLQAKNLLGACVDYVEVYEGEGAGWTRLGAFCGSLVPPTLNITGNTAVIRFISNHAGQEKGFQGYWTTDPSVIPQLTNPWDDISVDWPATCGVPVVPPRTPESRLLNSVEAEPHSWPWQVSLQGRLFPTMAFQHACGGSLIHQEWILTAAYCFTE